MIQRSRYAVLLNFILFFVPVSFIVRTILLIISFSKAGITPLSLARIYGQGFIYDITVALSFSALYALYLLFLPQRWNRSAINKGITYTGFSIVVLIIMFSFFAELAFWNEFESR